MTNIPIYQVDIATTEPFGGNPAAVCLLDEPKPDNWMRLLAREMNLSETAFLLPEGEGYRLRWFTPKVEVALCGHATLASAHILFETGRLAPEQIARFYTLSGLLTAQKCEDFIEINLPSRPVQSTQAPKGLVEALCAQPMFVGKNVDDYLVELDSDERVRTLQPDISAIGRLPARGVIVTARSATEGFDFISRFFAPAVGVPEDPVTGSAHTCLTPYWREKLGKNDMVGYQASERGGVLRVVQRGDRVCISAQSITIFAGELRI